MTKITSKDKHVEKLNKNIVEFIKTFDKSDFEVKTAIRTYDSHYNVDLNELFAKAKMIAQLGVEKHYNSSSQVKEFGIPSAISNAILRKYGRQKGIKAVNNVVIPVDKSSLKWENDYVTITPLKISFRFERKYHPNVLNIQHLEISPNGKVHVQCEVMTESLQDFTSFMGVDRNSTQFVCVTANTETGKVMKLGRDVCHNHRKYKSMRRKAVIEGNKTKKHHKYRKAHTLKHRERNKNHDSLLKIGKVVVTKAKEDKSIIVLEDLTGIRRKSIKPHKDKKTGKWVGNFKQKKSTRENLNSWAYYQLGLIICYLAHLLGVPVLFINPAYTSQNCSRSDINHIHAGKRDGKIFKCSVCGHADHADVNAAFNIARAGRLYIDRVVYNGEH